MASDNYDVDEKVLLIDCDPGVDDCIALMMTLAQYPKVKIVGITCANGNVGVRQVTLNALRIVKLFDMIEKVPVFQGCEEPIVVMPNVLDSAFYHGLDGLGDAPDVEPKRDEKLFDHLQEEHAVNAIIRMSKQYAGALQILCLGPLTNVALAAKLDPDIPKRLKSVHILGGTIRGYGNATPAAEYNFHVDPEAAQIVLRSFSAHCRVQLLTYEVTTDHTISKEWFDKLLAGDDRKRLFFRGAFQAARKWELMTNAAELAEGYTLCDAYLTAIVLDPSAVKKSRQVRMAVELAGLLARGSLIIDHEEKGSPYLSPKRIELVEEIDLDAYKRLLVEIFPSR